MRRIPRVAPDRRRPFPAMERIQRIMMTLSVGSKLLKSDNEYLYLLRLREPLIDEACAYALALGDLSECGANSRTSEAVASLVTQRDRALAVYKRHLQDDKDRALLRATEDAEAPEVVEAAKRRAEMADFAALHPRRCNLPD